MKNFILIRHSPCQRLSPRQAPWRVSDPAFREQFLLLDKSASLHLSLKGAKPGVYAQ